ncbi:hypothetical protein ACU639_19290 [Streptomyces cynarae]|uniref:hypothetical protein n=1 Tax=Streptomyces cynarae TaxID=2981134 RepID=UPI00406D0D13
MATEFGDGYGRVPFAMTAEGVARAGLAGLRLGETICAPGLEDQAAVLDALLATESALLTGGNRPTPATRYGRPPAR